MATTDRKVLICMDGSKFSDFAFSWYVSTFHKDGDHVILVHVHERDKGLHTVIGATDLRSNVEAATNILENETRENERMERHMQALIKKTVLPGKVMTLSGHATAGDAIVALSNAEKVDVIVCGSRGLGTVRRTFLGGISDYLVHHAHVPVVVCKMQATT